MIRNLFLLMFSVGFLYSACAGQPKENTRIGATEFVFTPIESDSVLKKKRINPLLFDFNVAYSWPRFNMFLGAGCNVPMDYQFLGFTAGPEISFGQKNPIIGPKIQATYSPLWIWYYPQLRLSAWVPIENSEAGFILTPELGFSVLSIVSVNLGYNIKIGGKAPSIRSGFQATVGLTILFGLFNGSHPGPVLS